MPGTGSGEAGDLLLNITVTAKPGWERKEMDVYSTVRIPFTTAVFGGEALVSTLYGLSLIHIYPAPGYRDPLCGGGRAVYKRKLGVRFQPDESEGILRFGCNWTSRDSDPAGTDDPFL